MDPDADIAEQIRIVERNRRLLKAITFTALAAGVVALVTQFFRIADWLDPNVPNRDIAASPSAPSSDTSVMTQPGATGRAT